MPEPVTAHSLPELKQLIACHECDLLMCKPSLALGEKAEAAVLECHELKSHPWVAWFLMIKSIAAVFAAACAGFVNTYP